MSSSRSTTTQLHLAARLAARCWRAGTRLHRALWERGPLEPHRASIPVVSVGSPLVGGAGKTPITLYCARLLANIGHGVVGIATRGYGRRDRALRVLRPAPEHDAGRVGDEPAMLARALWRAGDQTITIGVGPRRDDVVEHLADQFGATVAVLDDGAQHHRLARDLDIVVVPPDIESLELLPAGPLREPLDQLPRAALWWLHDPDGDAVGGSVDDMLGGHRIDVVSRYRPSYLECVYPGEYTSATCELSRGEQIRPGDLRSEAIALLTGVARGGTVRRVLGRELAIDSHVELRDHARFESPRGLVAGAPWWQSARRGTRRGGRRLRDLIRSQTRDPGAIVTTAKDWPRLRPVVFADPSWRWPVFVFHVELDVVTGRERLVEALMELT